MYFIYHASIICTSAAGVQLCCDNGNDHTRLSDILAALVYTGSEMSIDLYLLLMTIVMEVTSISLFTSAIHTHTASTQYVIPAVLLEMQLLDASF